MSKPLATTFFSTGPKDKTAAVDIYKDSGTNPINSVQALSEKVGFDASGLFGGSKNVLQGLTGLVAKTKDGYGFNKDALLKRVLTTAKGQASEIRNLAPDMKDLIPNSFKDYGAGLPVSIGEYTANIDGSKIVEFDQFGSLLNGYTSDEAMCKFVDKDATAGLITGMVSQGSDFGVSNVFTKLTDTVTDNGILNRVVMQCAPVALKAGNIDLLHEMSSTKMGKSIGFLYPDFSKELTQNYRSQGLGNPTNSLGDYNKLIGTLTNVASDWNTLERKGLISTGEDSDMAINLVALLAGSKSFQKLIVDGVRQLTTHDDKSKFYPLASLYQKTTVEAQIRRCFPKLVLFTDQKKSQKKNRQVVDPVALLALGGAILG